MFIIKFNNVCFVTEDQCSSFKSDTVFLPIQFGFFVVPLEKTIINQSVHKPRYSRCAAVSASIVTPSESSLISAILALISSGMR